MFLNIFNNFPISCQQKVNNTKDLLQGQMYWKGEKSQRISSTRSLESWHIQGTVFRDELWVLGLF